MKRLLFKSWPYFTSFGSGVLLFFLATRLQEDYKGLLINISATLLAIPLLFLIYELARGFSSRKLNEELFDYAKMQVDREAMSILMQLIKLIHPYGKQDNSQRGAQSFLNQSQKDILDLFKNATYLGFQVLKRWTVSEDNLANILENPLILRTMDDDQTIAITRLLKSIHWLEDLHRNIASLYTIGDSKDSEYVTKSGAQISERNTNFPDRHVLLKRLGKDKFVVMDFGDFAPFEVSGLLKRCKVNPNHTEMLSQAVFGVIEAINEWIASTGDEFIVDTRMFRMRVPA